MSDKSSESSLSEWFPFKPYAPLKADLKGEYWSYFTFRIPQGVAGATLTLESRNVPTSGAEFYIRYEGLPALEHHDLHMKSNDAVLKSNFDHSSAKSHTAQDEREESGLQDPDDGVTLSMMFPLEGTWCIGVRVVNGELLKHLVSQNDAVEQVKSLPPLTPESAPYVGRVVRWFIVKAGRSVFGGKLTESSSSLLNIGVSVEGGNITTPAPYSVQSSVSEERDSVSRVAYQGSEYDFEIPQMRVAIHGCLNYCSGHGSCQTTYDSSRLYQYR